MTALADTFEKAAAGQPAFFSWRTLVAGTAPARHETRHILLVQPVMDYAALQPGQRASEAIRAAARSLGLDPAHGVTVRLTGPVPLADEEFALARPGCAPAHGRDGRGAAGDPVAGGALGAHRARDPLHDADRPGPDGGHRPAGDRPLQPHLGGLHPAVRRPRRRFQHPVQRPQPGRAARPAEARGGAGRDGRGIGTALALSAAAIGAGFFAFLPTSYVGVAELGTIAGLGMVVAFVLSIVLLPALLVVLRPPPAAWRRSASRCWRRSTPSCTGIAGGSWPCALAAAVVSLALLPLLRFDFDPLNLKSPTVESMTTLQALARRSRLDALRDQRARPVAGRRGAAGAPARRAAGGFARRHASTASSRRSRRRSWC